MGRPRRMWENTLPLSRLLSGSKCSPSERCQYRSPLETSFCTLETLSKLHPFQTQDTDHPRECKTFDPNLPSDIRCQCHHIRARRTAIRSQCQQRQDPARIRQLLRRLPRTFGADPQRQQQRFFLLLTSSCLPPGFRPRWNSWVILRRIHIFVAQGNHVT